MDDESTMGLPAAGVLRRLGALAYDSVLLLALLLAGTLALLPLTGGEAIDAAAQGPGAYVYRGYLVLLAFAYFGLSWTRRGQTLGMKAWKIRLTGSDGAPPRWPAAALRFSLAVALVLAAGFVLWLVRRPDWPVRHLAGAALILALLVNYLPLARDPRRRSLQDLACGSRVVRLP